MKYELKLIEPMEPNAQLVETDYTGAQNVSAAYIPDGVPLIVAVEVGGLPPKQASALLENVVQGLKRVFGPPGDFLVMPEHHGKPLLKFYRVVELENKE